MAKKKTKRNPKAKGFSYYVELHGIILILISIIGICIFGPAGNIIRGFAVFLAGSFSFIPLLLIMVLGGYMMVKREVPNFFSERLIGLYLVILCLLIGAHFSYFEVDNLTFAGLMETTFDRIMEAINSWQNNPSLIHNIFGGTVEGGGIIGAVVGYVFVVAFDITGAKIVALIIGIVGALLLFNVSLMDQLRRLREKYRERNSEEKKLERKVAKAERKFDKEKDKDVVIESNTPKDGTLDAAPRSAPLLSGQTIGDYHLPPMSTLLANTSSEPMVGEAEIKRNIAILETTFKDFDIEGKVVDTHTGPSITQYEMELKAGTKVNKVKNIDNELKLALAAKDIRIQAPIPGKSTIGIEIPNKKLAMVRLREILEAAPEDLDDSKLLVGLGKDVMGTAKFTEINKTPHLLIAGATGSGKSIGINTVIVSILMRATPDEVKLVLIDPKKVELSMYEKIPHLLMPVVNDPKHASNVLKKVVADMEGRYELFKKSSTKNIAGYNSYVKTFNKNKSDEEKKKPLPYIVVIVDELADLMMVAGKEVEESIVRITQMARAAGIHLIVATQRPSTDVISGLIKANIPSKISFACSSGIDSRTILDETGAEKLLGKGDMLFRPMDQNQCIRIQGAFISESEIKKVVDFIKLKNENVTYDPSYEQINEKTSFSGSGNDDDYDDPIYNEVVAFVKETKKASASLLQRRFRLGYNRAARLIDLLEDRGIIGPAQGSKPREVFGEGEEDND